MRYSEQFFAQHLPAFAKNKNLFLLWGIGIILLGLFAIGATTFTTLLTVVVLGFLILFSGAIIAIDTITFWWGKWRGFFLHGIVALLYLMAGTMLIVNPVQGSISLTFLLGIVYILLGLFRMGLATSLRTPRWGWSLGNGVINLVLGVLILLSWPASGMFVIGLFVGIDLVFCGWAYVMASLAVRNMVVKGR